MSNVRAILDVVYVEYFYWQFVAAPVWLLTVSWNLQRALFQYFSVPTMVRTLVAHWHRDAVAYQGGSISQYALAFAWNLISRAIGFLIRSIVLGLWLVSTAVLAFLGVEVFALFILWPLLVLIGFAVGLAVLFF